MNDFKKNLPFVSIILPCRNEEKFINACLNSIIQQNYPSKKMEILVIDGDSKDNTKNIIKKYSLKYSFIKLLNNPKKNTPFAFNMGVKNSKGSFIFIMGAHAKYKNNYILKCIETAIKYKADNVGGVLKTIPRTNNIIDKTITECLSSFFGVGGSHFRKGSKRITIVDTVFGGCYQKNVFNKIGLFNENLIRSQDIEFNLRLKKANGKILLNPEIVTYYYPISDFKTFIKRNFVNGIWVIYPFKFSKIIPISIRHIVPLIFNSTLIIFCLLSFFYSIFLYLFIFIIVLYLLVNLFFSFLISIKKNILYIFTLPIIFLALHVSYGLGSIYGLITLPFLKND